MFGGEIAIHGFAPPTLTRQFEEVAQFVDDVGRRLRILSGPERQLDTLATHLFFTAPIICDKLRVGTSLPPTLRLAIALAPWCGPIAYKHALPIWHQLLMMMPEGDWQAIELPQIDPPAELSMAALFGHQVISVEDYTGDGIEEVLVACPLASPSDGEARLLLVDGRSRQTIASIAGHSPVHLFAHTIATIADLDGDGHREWLVGCPSGATDVRHGHVEVWSGKQRKLLHRITGDEPGFGACICDVGDADGDGVADFAIASPPLLRNSAAQGWVQVFSGRTYAPIITWRNDQPGVWFGACMANARDVDGDGSDDLIVGGNYGRAPGLVRVYSVSKQCVLHSWRDPSASSGFGSFVAAAGDVDRDGCGDVVVSAIGADAVVDKVFVYSGRTGLQLATLSGQKPGDGFGKSVVAMRLSDGVTVLAIGAPFAGSPSTGSLELVSLQGERIAAVFGPFVNGAFGWNIAATGDSDLDLLPELFVAGPNGNRQGRVWRVPSSQWLTNQKR